MAEKWGPTEQGLAFLYAAPKYEGGWLKLLGLFGMAFVLSLFAGLAGIGIGYGVAFIFEICFEALGRATGQDVTLLNAWLKYILASLISATFAMLGLIYVIRTKSKVAYDRFRDTCVTINWRQFAIGIVVFLVVEVLVFKFGINLLGRIWPDGPISSALFSGAKLEPLNTLVGLAQPTPLHFLYLVVLAPVVFLQTGAEEIAFRGAWLQQLGGLRRGWVLPAMVSSVVFGLFHIGGGAIVLLVIMLGAIAWSYAALRFGNVSYGWGAHFANNYFFFALMPLLPIDIAEIPALNFNEGPDLSGENGAAIAATYLTVYILVLAINVAVIAWLTRAYPIAKPGQNPVPLAPVGDV